MNLNNYETHPMRQAYVWSMVVIAHIAFFYAVFSVFSVQIKTMAHSVSSFMFIQEPARESSPYLKPEPAPRAKRIQQHTNDLQPKIALRTNDNPEFETPPQEQTPDNIDTTGNETNPIPVQREEKPVVHPPSYLPVVDLSDCKPQYPSAALLADQTGTVKIQFLIGADDKLLNQSILHSSGYGILDKAALSALSHCQFKAAVKDGVPVASKVVISYDWAIASARIQIQD